MQLGYLTSKDVYGVYSFWSGCSALSFDNSKVMSIDRENIVRVASHGQKAEMVMLALFDIDDGQINRECTNISSLSIDQGGIRHLNNTDVRSKLVVPACKKANQHRIILIKD
jgi:hypothetical protein